jgi:hypothetical protein
MSEAEKQEFYRSGEEIPLVWENGKLIPYKNKKG